MPQPSWVRDAVFYHVYPLGACGALEPNDFVSAPVSRLDRLLPWVDTWAELGVTAVYLGPVFESSTHGYDTADYFRVDRRLGDDEVLARFVGALHARGIRVLFDAVFHHVGRHFWAFRDVREKGPASPYASWFAGLRFDRRNRFGDPFVYDTWRGIEELVKLNLHDDAVRAHLFEAVTHWVRRFDVDGLRLDAADEIDPAFFDHLAAHCERLEKPLWLLGEVIHGDYTRWARPGRLHATTDYTLWKALWSAHNDRNYFELAHTLKRQAGPRGIYEGLSLYTFADNHDVDRLASVIKDPRHLPLVYLLLFTLPGVPALYYGSEWGQQGTKRGGDDRPLRPELPPPPGPMNSLREAISGFIRLRHAQRALRHGTYVERVVRNEQFAFSRVADGEEVVVVVNAANAPADVELPVGTDGPWRDLLDPGASFSAQGGRLSVTGIASCAGRVLRSAHGQS